MVAAFCTHIPLSKRTKCFLPCTCSPRSLRLFQLSMSSGKTIDFRRREVLKNAAVLSLALVFMRPNTANALSKKRILAKAGPINELPGGITYRDITIGKGYVPREGDSVAIHYSLFYNDLEIESSRESQGLAASPIGFTFGARSGPGSVLRGLNDGIQGMKVGGLRLVTVPPELAFGARGKPPLIPGSATVEFAISLLSCKRAGVNPNSIIDPKAQVF